MTVTFAAAAPDTTVRVFRLTCETLGTLGEWAGCDNAYSEAKAHALVCTNSLCADYGADVDEVSDLPVEVNMANDNARRVLDVLGYPTGDDELDGDDSADAFLGRVVLALALAPYDEGMPARELVGGEQLIPGGRQFHCGRPAGDLQGRLRRLHDLAVDCQRRGLSVQWY